MTEKIILLINRDRTFLDHTTPILKKAGYSIRTATGVRETLTVLSSSSVGLIICDNKLKDINGMDLLYFLKNDPLREQIPFLFLVSTKNQGDAFKAFELNAADYLVYPLEDEILIDRIDEVFSTSGLKPAPPVKPPEIEPEAADENQSGPIAVSSVAIDVSRDSAIWLPGKILSFDQERLFIETSLFGKPDMFLMVRLNIEGESVTINGHIKEISYEDFQKPASIEMAAQEEETWQRAHAYLTAKFGQVEDASDKSDASDVEQEVLDLGDDFLSPAELPEKNIIQTGTFKPAAVSKPSYDQRFYYSIIGKQLDNYRAITLIGTSAMGGLMQGWDVDQEREVALKVISYHLSSNQNFYQAFFKDAQAVYRLAHPNIAQIYYFGSSNDILYYATEFVDGQTVEDLIERHGNLNNIKSLEHLISICETLGHTHRNGIFHHNIKPANIMVDSAGEIKLIDFGMGLSGIEGETDEKNPAIRASIYMSPEQAAGRGVDNRSDIYSVGATFYHAFTGCPPFEAEDPDGFVSQPIKTPLPPVREKNPDIPPALAQIIEKMMSKAPLNRYQDFQAVLKDIKTLHARVTKRKRPAS